MRSFPLGCWVVAALAVLLPLVAPTGALAGGPAPFDMVGPTLIVSVTHQGRTLPAAQTPALAAGDQLSIRADLGPDQSQPYLLIAAFLRGAVNPPPKAWFFSAKTWTKDGAGGLKIAVPAGAEQALIFLAPRTGGDFDTLVGAVRGRPGAFVHAAQELNQSFLDRTRLDAFLAQVQAAAGQGPDRLAAVSPLLARSLAIKLNPECLQLAPDQQAACLTQGRDALVIDDGHSATVAHTLTSGPSSDLIQQLSATPQGGGGYYSAYVATVMDFVRVLDSLRTAQYQYIPTLEVRQGDGLSLRLNTAPSFHPPLSVLVAALPAVGPAPPPPLRPVEAGQAYCAANAELLLPVEGAPLVFSTLYAHDLVLHLTDAAGKPIDLPLRADAAHGGLVVDGTRLVGAKLGAEVEAQVRGEWGFSPFEGPMFRLQAAQPGHWALDPRDQLSLIIGRESTVRLRAPSSACVNGVAIRTPDGGSTPIAWKHDASGEVAVTAPLQQARPGRVTLLISQQGLADPDAVSLQTYAETARVDGFDIHGGDAYGVLHGARLDEIASLKFAGAAFTAGELTTIGGQDELRLTIDPAQGQVLTVGQSGVALIRFKDGRSAKLDTVVAPPRPVFSLIDGSLRTESPTGSPFSTGHLVLTDKTEAPAGAVLTFALKAEGAQAFAGDETVEVEADGGRASAVLSFTDGLMLQDAHVAVATLDTAAAFSKSTFGPLRARVVARGVAGDWLPLAILVRLPVLEKLDCAAGAARPCRLIGQNLFLIQALSADPRFDSALQVPDGDTAPSLPAPHVGKGPLYLKLRDAQGVVNQAIFTPLVRASP